jgi:hypothetical protein
VLFSVIRGAGVDVNPLFSLEDRDTSAVEVAAVTAVLAGVLVPSRTTDCSCCEESSNVLVSLEVIISLFSSSRNSLLLSFSVCISSWLLLLVAVFKERRSDIHVSTSPCLEYALRTVFNVYLYRQARVIERKRRKEKVESILREKV